MRGIPGQPVTCEVCGNDEGCPTDKRCSKCRIKAVAALGRKYTFTPEMDEMIRRIYADNASNRKELRRGLDRFAQMYRFPRHVPRYRAQRLGVTRDTRHPWTPEEIEILRELSGVKPVRYISERLKRGPTTVQAMMDRLKISRAVLDGYSREQVAQVTGASTKSIARWIDQGRLRVDTDTDRVTEASLARFLRNHQDCYSLKRVDEMWFKDMIFSRAGSAAVQERAE